MSYNHGMSEKIDFKLIQKIVPKRTQNSNKFTYGKVLNIAGSKNYRGAAYLSSISALKVGAGYVTLAAEECVISAISSLTCDLTCLPLSDTDEFFEDIAKYDVFSIGCGLSRSPFSKNLVETFVNNFKDSASKFVFDADALNIISELKNVTLPKHSVITPHAKELARLLNVEVDEISKNREAFAKKAAEKFNCVVVLKGHETIIDDNNGKVFQNTTGNSALSKAGTGDILTGMIAGFMAQGASSKDASVLAVYLHGLAADLYVTKFNEYTMLASDLLNWIPLAMKTIAKV